MHDRYRNRYRVPKATQPAPRSRSRSRRRAGSIRRSGRRTRVGGRLARRGRRQRSVRGEAEGGGRAGPSHPAGRSALRRRGPRATRRALERVAPAAPGEPGGIDDDEDEPAGVAAMADHLDRFAIYKMRLSRWNRSSRMPAIIPRAMRSITACRSSSWRARPGRTTRSSCWRPCCTTSARRSTRRTTSRAGVESLRGAVTERTLWLIEHHMDLLAIRERGLSARGSAASWRVPSSTTTSSSSASWTTPGECPASRSRSLDEALAYIKGLESESYLEGGLGIETGS